MLLDAAAVVLAYAIGSVPAAYLAGRARGVDLRERGSGNIGASNVWHTASRSLVIPVGLAQIGQGAAAVLLAHWWDRSVGVQAAAGVAAVLAHDWNPWLRLSGGRGIGLSIGVIGVLSPFALLAFVIVSAASVAGRAIPQGVALGLMAAPLAAAASGDAPAAVAGCGLLAAVALVKRVAANGPPGAEAPRPDVWWNRLLYDRDIRDRESWVRRGTSDQGFGIRDQ